MGYWNDRVAIVFGASRGLGLHLAQELARHGARLVLVGRDPGALEALRQREPFTPDKTLIAPGDVTCAAQVERIVSEAVGHFGGLDAALHCVGKSMRGGLLETPEATWDELWRLNVVSAFLAARATAGRLAERRGHFVAIGSLASKTASPYLGAYPVTKAALAMFCHQLRLEWSPKGLHVLLVCPGPIARTDAGQRYAEQAAGLPPEAQRPGGGVKLASIDPQDLARAILRACRQRRLELVVPARARWLFALQQLAPAWGDRILRTQRAGAS